MSTTPAVCTGKSWTLIWVASVTVKHGLLGDTEHGVTVIPVVSTVTLVVLKFADTLFDFGFVHIIFRNNLAVILCILGGFLFSLTYHQSGSLLLTCLDHTLFGNFLFTIGLGQFFYHRSASLP